MTTANSSVSGQVDAVQKGFDGSDTTIAERVEALNEGLAGQMPEAAQAAFGAELVDLDAAGAPSGVTSVGSAMPDGDLLDAHGNPTTLAAACGGKPAMIVTYRGAWCPFCNLALRAYQEQLVPVLAERGIELVAVSPQKPDGSLSMAEKNELTFIVLSDPGNQIGTGLGVLTAPTEAARRAHRIIGINLPQANADGGYGVPMPTVVLVDASGTIRWIDVHPNYTTRTEVSTIVAALELV